MRCPRHTAASRWRIKLVARASNLSRDRARAKNTVISGIIMCFEDPYEEISGTRPARHGGLQ